MSNAIGIHPIVSQLLINRDITDFDEAQRFLSADLTELADPYLMKDMHKAVERIQQARDRKENVIIFGDYDVDGVTSSAILRKALVEMGISVTNHIPHRFHDGYGLNHEVAEIARDKGVSLLITVDCGITALSEVKSLNEMGVDVIIVDHHHPGPELPNAYAVINPKQKDCSYPFKDFATVGLVAKLVHALRGQFDKDILDLVALGTIADIVPLRGENRIFVKIGLPLIKETKNHGLSALLEISKIKDKELRPYHVGFVLGPRINASGRMDSAHDSLDLLLSDNHLRESQRIAPIPPILSF